MIGNLRTGSFYFQIGHCGSAVRLLNGGNQPAPDIQSFKYVAPELTVESSAEADL
jgi:hypothetical protein